MSDAAVPHKADSKAPRLPARRRVIGSGARFESDVFYSFRRSRLTMVGGGHNAAVLSARDLRRRFWRCRTRSIRRSFS